MRQRWLQNLILLGVVLVLGALVFYTTEKDKSTELPKLTEIETDKVQNIRIERAGKGPISLIKDAGGVWQMTAPFNLPANSFQVDRLLQILSEREYKPVEADNLNLAELKLEPPLASLKFDQVIVAFGDSSPLGYGQRYVQVNNKVYLLSDTLYYTVIGDVLKFVSLSPLGDNPKITALKIPDYHLVLKEDKWTLTSTVSSDDIDTSADALSSLIDNWQKASAYKVELYDTKSIAEGEIDITLQGQEQPLHFIIVSKAPDLVLARQAKSVQYQLSVTQIDKLLHLPTKPKSEDASAESEEKEATEDSQ